ncbi:MAG: hypothetical protein BWZ00_00465 [Bacteroidetes bacterium ADurb.BinA174]|nr:MAG: hypothetical protein BWZ00_00465 [Bacteroidetes bacterium ADurb.BinA174]
MKEYTFFIKKYNTIVCIQVQGASLYIKGLHLALEM